jgi:2-dehydropantoate 2-reductase
MNITILGTGAMACLFGARLAPVADVSLVGGWAAGLAALRTMGIQVEDGASVIRQPVRAAAGDEPTPPADLVMVLVKAWQTPWAAQQVARRLSPGGAVLTLQNGLGNLEALRAAAGRHAYLGVTTLGATLLGPGRVRPGGAGPIHVAGPAWIAQVLARAGFDAHTSDESHIDGLLWGKLAVNCGINALTALLRVPNGELLRRPSAASLMTRAARECAAVAAAKDIVLPFADAAEQAADVAERTAANHSSMFQDILRGAPTEINAINGAVAQLGPPLGVAVPVNDTLWHLVRALAEAPVRPHHEV